MYWQGLLNYSIKQERKKKMKDLFNTVLDTLLWLMLWGMGIYAILSFAAYTAAAEEPPLTKDEQTIAITLMGEARGEGEAGLYAVGCVIQKRAEERKLTLAQVCLQKRVVKGRTVWQFSCWNDKPYIETMKRLLKANTKQAKYSKRLARAMSAGGKLTQAFTGNANHYHANYVTPYWVKSKIPSKIIGKHLFYKLP